jgi:hypothetical protein
LILLPFIRKGSNQKNPINPVNPVRKKMGIQMTDQLQQTKPDEHRYYPENEIELMDYLLVIWKLHQCQQVRIHPNSLDDFSLNGRLRPKQSTGFSR